jgi:hypothetical protein
MTDTVTAVLIAADAADAAEATTEAEQAGYKIVATLTPGATLPAGTTAVTVIVTGAAAELDGSAALHTAAMAALPAAEA